MKPPSNDRPISLSQKFLSVKDLKLKLKDHKLSINDYFMACLSKACKAYIHKRDPQNKVKVLGSIVGVSTREKFGLGNDIAGTFVRVYLPTDPKAPLK